MGSFGTVLYRSVTKRFATLFLTAIIGAYAAETIIVRGNDYYWEQVGAIVSVFDQIRERHNKGKLWKDVKAQLEAKGRL